MRRCVISTFLLTLVIAYLGSKSFAQCPGSVAQCPVITQPKVGTDSISVTPIDPAGGTASADVFASCDKPTGPSLLKSNSQNGIYGSGTISLILTNPLPAGQTLCVVETINGALHPSARVTVPTPLPVPATAAPAKLVVQPVTAGQTSVTVITVPFDSGTETIDLFPSCDDVGDKSKSLVEPKSAQTIGGTSSLFRLQLKTALKEGGIVCATETQSGKPQPIVSLPVIASAAIPIPPPSSPIITGTLNDSTTRFRVSGQPNDNNYTSSTLYVCVWPATPAKPSSGTTPSTGTPDAASSTPTTSKTPSTSATPPANNALDCTALDSKVPPTNVKGSKLDTARMYFVEVDKSGQTDITLPSPPTPGESVSIVQVSTPVTGKAQTILSPQPYLVGTAQQCNHKPLEHPYSDCDLSFSLIGGVEQAALSSQPSETNGFLRAFTAQDLVAAKTHLLIAITLGARSAY